MGNYNNEWLTSTNEPKILTVWIDLDHKYFEDFIPEIETAIGFVMISTNEWMKFYERPII